MLLISGIILPINSFAENFTTLFQVQLLIAVGVVCLFTFHQPTQLWVQRNFWIWIVALVVFIVTMIALACCEGLRRKAPGNFILLGLFTVAQSFMMGVMAANFDRFEVVLALGVS